MKTHPILFSTPMVQAILAGRKTMTRRVIKPQPKGVEGFPSEQVCAAWQNGFVNVKCPYGEYDSAFDTASGLLWVRETFSEMPDGDIVLKAGFPDAAHLDDIPPKWKPSIFMPRWTSRITLEITDIRVERLQDISHEDAVNEGVNGGFGENYDCAKHSFMCLWQKINGTKSWDDNPWVWAICFRPIFKNIDDVLQERGAV